MNYFIDLEYKEEYHHFT